MSLSIARYSTLSIVVRGDTKTYKDSLKLLGGKYNPKLTGGPGWIFPEKNRGSVEEFVFGVNSENSKIDKDETKQLDSKSNTEKVWAFIEKNIDGVFLRGIYSTEKLAKEAAGKCREKYEDWYEECGFDHIVEQIAIDEKVKITLKERTE